MKQLLRDTERTFGICRRDTIIEIRHTINASPP